jgi:DNA-binding transcriptional ArsR family regulator
MTHALAPSISPPSNPSGEDQRNDQLDLVFHALADRTRRALMVRLALGPGTISELAAPFNMSLPAVSKHIRVLEQGALVTREVDGRIHRCTLSASALRDADAWLAHYRQFRPETLDSLANYLEQS